MSRFMAKMITQITWRLISDENATQNVVEGKWKGEEPCVDKKNLTSLLFVEKKYAFKVAISKQNYVRCETRRAEQIFIRN